MAGVQGGDIVVPHALPLNLQVATDAPVVTTLTAADCSQAVVKGTRYGLWDELTQKKQGCLHLPARLPGSGAQFAVHCMYSSCIALKPSIATQLARVMLPCLGE